MNGTKELSQYNSTATGRKKNIYNTKKANTKKANNEAVLFRYIRKGQNALPSDTDTVANHLVLI